jgi:hypothetical protein
MNFWINLKTKIIQIQNSKIWKEAAKVKIWNPALIFYWYQNIDNKSNQTFKGYVKDLIRKFLRLKYVKSSGKKVVNWSINPR